MFWLERGVRIREELDEYCVERGYRLHSGRWQPMFVFLMFDEELKRSVERAGAECRCFRGKASVRTKVWTTRIETVRICGNKARVWALSSGRTCWQEVARITTDAKKTCEKARDGATIWCAIRFGARTVADTARSFYQVEADFRVMNPRSSGEGRSRHEGHRTVAARHRGMSTTRKARS